MGGEVFNQYNPEAYFSICYKHVVFLSARIQINIISKLDYFEDFISRIKTSCDIFVYASI